jgi:hypothetical protein
MKTARTGIRHTSAEEGLPEASIDVRCQADVRRSWTVDALDDVDEALGVLHYTGREQPSDQSSVDQFTVEILTSM